MIRDLAHDPLVRAGGLFALWVAPPASALGIAVLEGLARVARRRTGGAR